MLIESKKITRKCKLCNKEYEDEQTIINRIPCAKYAICPECRSNFEREFELLPENAAKPSASQCK